MTTLLPTSQSTGVEAYEDMFKEITRKLYGEESAHGLYPHNTQVAQLAPGAPTAPPEGGERSFTTLVSDRAQSQIGYETTTVGPAAESGQHHQSAAAGSAGSFKPEEHISTAFGLAALMQNGFPPPGAILNPVNFPSTSKTPTNISTPSSDNRWQTLNAADDSWNVGKQSSSSAGYGGKSYKKPKTEPQDANGAGSGLNIPSTADRTSKGSGYSGASGSSNTGTPNAIKRYGCTTCPYTTDRRDLFTRHENIHKDEKPFQCYACLKPFNRADHVKKHFLRMHRELEYDIAKTRRYPPSAGSSNSKGSYYHGHAQTANGAGSGGTSTSTTSTTPSQMQQLNIPSGNFGSAGGLSLSGPSHALEGGSGHHHSATPSSVINGAHSGQLLHLHSLHQQQQLQQQQHNIHHSSITIKQEKGIGSGSGGSSLNTSASSTGGSPDEKSFVKKIKGEKKFACTFCPWAGADNWGLKRHLNTHTKPYVCLLCDYKAARSERLATHVFKVHNKKACSKCSFFAEDQAHLDAHLQEAHPHDPTKTSKHTGVGNSGGNGNCGSNTAAHHSTGATVSHGNVLRNLGNAFTSNNLPTNIPTSGNGFGTGTPANGHYHTAGAHHASTGNVLTNSNAANLIDTIHQHLASAGQQNGNGGAVVNSLQQHHHQQQQQQHWMMKPERKRNGAELLYSYLEADGSDSGDYARLLHMQAVGRNKASVTQDFHNAGGGDNGINGDHSSGSSNGSISAATNPLYGASKAERMKKETPGGANSATGSGPDMSKANTDNVALSLASLLGGDQLSFLQLLATAAVAHQQLQRHSTHQLPYAQDTQQRKQQHQSQPKPSKAAAAHQPAGAPSGNRYGSSMVSSPPATSTKQQLHPRTATANSTSARNGWNSTNGTTTAVPNSPAATAATSEVTITNSNGHYPSPTMASTTAGYALDSGGTKKRRINAASSKDKENFIHRNGLASSHHHHQSAATSVASNIIISTAIVAGGNAGGGHHHTGGSKMTHHNHHHNNNNTSTSNKNINDIFDKVYKKPQNSFTSTKQHSLPNSAPPVTTHPLPPSILRTAPPSAVEEDNRMSCPVTIESEGQQFSLTEFLKSHTEVSISTVGGSKEDDADDALYASDASTHGVATFEPTERDFLETGSLKRKTEAERNPRKQQQPRRFDDFDDEVALNLSTAANPAVKEELTDTLSAEGSTRSLMEKANLKSDTCEEMRSSAGSCVSRLADIRDKHMTQLVTRRRCCRICQNKGLLDHLDNYHYHSKISLILHTRWRHGRVDPVVGDSAGKIRCRQCGSQFGKRYQLALHKRVTQHTNSIVANGSQKRSSKESSRASPSEERESSGKENLIINGTNSSVSVKSSHEKKDTNGRRKKKQRKRKPRSRCFTPRRRK